MKDRILFWIEDSIEHFGIAKFFIEKYECEPYAIIDTNNTLKNFFLQQQLIHFQNVWYFRDHISKNKRKADLKYLISFEQKYKIGLWLLAYSERKFFQFNEYHKFSYDEILAILEQECQFFEHVLDEIKPHFLLIRLTDLHRLHLLHEICKARGIKVLMMSTTRFGYRVMISTDFDKVDNFDSNHITGFSDRSKTVEELENYINKFSIYQQLTNPLGGGIKLSKWKIIMKHLRFLLLTCKRNYRDFYDNYGMTPIRIITKKEFIIPYLIKRWHRQSFLNKYSISTIDSNTPFVYFPLHVEPERTLSLTAPFYTNQNEIIIHVAKSLPIGYKLYVKENYNMSSKPWRDISFYKKILELFNVQLVHPSVKPDILMKNCSLVITISGTSGLEAAFYKKPSIVFADVSYSYLPFVHRIKNIEELPQVIRTCLQKEFDFSSLNHYVNLINENSFEFDMDGLNLTIGSELFVYKGMLIDTDIQVPKIESFLKRHASKFEKLALEYIKKIQQYKKNEENR